MQFGHCGIPLSIKGGPSHGEQQVRRAKRKEGNTDIGQRSSEANLGSERERYLQDLHLEYLEQGLRGAQLSDPSSYLLHLGGDGVD
jgi:hypothetical protein